MVGALSSEQRLALAAALTGTADGTARRSTSVRRGRVVGLDIARSLALLAMFIAHFAASVHTNAGTWQSRVVGFTDGRAMPLFILLGGCGATFLLARSRRPWREMTGRAIVLLLLGLAFAATQPVAVILQAYAVYFLLAVAAAKLPTRWLLPTAAAVTGAGALSVMFVTRHLPTELDYRDSVSDTFGSLGLLAKPHVLLSDIFITGYYPVFPCFGFILVGMWVARIDLTSRRFRVGLVAAGIALFAVGYGAGALTEGQREDLTSATDQILVGATQQHGAFVVDTSVIVERSIGSVSGAIPGAGSIADPDGWDLLDQKGHSHMPAWMIGATGWSLLVIGLCLLLPGWARKMMQPLVALGQFALTAYVAQLILFRWPLKDWPGDRGPTTQIMLTVAGWASLAIVAWAWKARSAHGPLEYLLRLAGRLTSWVPSRGVTPSPR